MASLSEITARKADVMKSVRPVLHFIDGRFVPSQSGQTFETVNPVDNMPITTVAAGDAGDVNVAVAAARKAFEETSWAHLGAGERARILRRIADGIEARGDLIVDLEVLDTGMPITQARGQAARGADNFRFFASVIESMHTDAFPVDGSFLNYSTRKPVGVAGLITPWNTPFMLETWKIAPCLAAGDTCVLKPAEWSPLSAAQLAEVITEAGVPNGVFNIVNGIGEVAGAPLVAHPGVSLISFTGETSTGKTILREGAETLKRFSMELGGKSPIIVFADCDIERAIDAVVFGIYSLNGERCTASSRLLVEESIHEQFVDEVARRTERVKVGDPFDPATELGPLISDEHFNRVTSYIEAGRREGATVRAGGGRPTEYPDGNFLEATLLTDVTPQMRVFQEEIFGPVLVATPFRTDREAIALGNQVKYGLAAYIWTSDLQRAHVVADSIDAGLTWVNSQNVRDLRTPFGGMKSSGIGREGGEFSFEFYCELKTIHVAVGKHRIPRLGAG